jgi:PST family polysaccharide transporter
MLIQTLGSKVVGIVGQVVLAWLLAKSDFGLVALAGTAVGFASLLQQLGLNKILVQRHGNFKSLANAAFWMGVASGIAASLLMVAAVPVATAVYQDRRLIGLILVLALVPPLDALAIVPTAYQSLHLRFRTLAVLGLISNVLTVALSLGFALLGLGVYAFVLPKPLVALATAAALWGMTPMRPRLNPQFRRWRFLAKDAGFLLATSLATVVISQGDYMSLGAFHVPEVVGVFYFAFNLSTQPVQLLVVNLVNVLFPVLSRLQDDPPRQTAAFLRSERILAIVGLPLSGVQALLAQPAIYLVFGSKWEGAIPVFQVLSLAMGFAMLYGLAINLIQAQGRFWTQCWWSCLLSGVFLTGVLGASYLGASLAVAATEVCFYMVASVATVHLAIAGHGGSVRDTAGVFATPLVLSMLTLAPVGGLAYALADRSSPLVQLVAVGGAAAVLYLVALRWIFPADWAAIRQQVLDVLARRRKSLAMPASTA